MANNNLSNNENILVKVDQNNLIYIDPNSVIDNDGNVQPRGVEAEKLVMYANLEADIIPRSILVAGNDQKTLTSIARGTLNFLSNQDGKDYDTTWTDSYLNFTEKTKDVNFNLFGNSINLKVGTGEFYQSDSGGQSFGIDSISVSIRGVNSIPQVNINFIDVRGKTLFESAENSPYKAFFHLPWPIFYLTIKGFYGKAIRYRLHLIKFNTRYNESNGNFEVATTFVGSTFAYLNDIPLKGILNSPYMFGIENTKDTSVNGKTDTSVRKISKSSRGYQVLKTVYSEYKQKGLIPKNFPIKTLRELIVVAQSLDKTLEREILDQVLDGRIFVGLKDFADKISKFEESVKAWAGKNLLSSYSTLTLNTNESIRYYELSTLKTDPKFITGSTTAGTLEFIITNYTKLLNESELFNGQILKNNTNTNFNKSHILSKGVGKVGDYYREKDTQFQVAIDELVNDIYDIRNTFTQQKDKLEQVVQDQMNNIIVNDKTKGIGFEPTIRNIFAVILANAEVYIRLMRETHINAFKESETRKKLIFGLSDETKGKDAIYPWPEIKKNAEGQKQKVIAYPGEQDLVAKLQSDNKTLWPEINFVENYIDVATNRSDPNAEKETGVNNINIVYESDEDSSKIAPISTLDAVSSTVPYIDKSPSSFLYEIFERANIFTSYESFGNETLKELAEIEFENIKEAIKEDNEIIGLLNQKVKNGEDLISMMKSYSPFERYPYYQDQLPTIPYLKDVVDNSFSIEQYEVSDKSPIPYSYQKLNDNLLNYLPESYRKDIYPFNSDTYLSYLNQTKFTIDEFRIGGNLSVDPKQGFIVSPINPNAWVKTGGDYNKNIFTQKINVNDTNINILNTSYFHNQLYFDFTKTGSYGKYVGSAYLLLNSLPFYDLEDKISFDQAINYFGGSAAPIRMSSLFREVGSTHYVPYHLILKWGAIYHRYKNYLLNGNDILSGCINSSNVTKTITGSTFFNNNETGPAFTAFTISANTVTYSGAKDIGVHPYYDAIFHQVINGYNHYEVASGNTSFSNNVNLGAIKYRLRQPSNNLKYWTGFVDNSKFDATDLRYTLLPSDGDNLYIDKKQVTIPTGTIITGNTDTFNFGVQNYLRTIWEDGYINDDFSGKTFPSYKQYHRSYVTGTTRNTYDNKYSISTNYRKVLDLIGTFSPKILEEFESLFLDFASSKIKDEIEYYRFPYVSYTKFQDLLKEICTVYKLKEDTTDVDTLIRTIKTRQKELMEYTTSRILSTSNLLKLTIGNPKEININMFHGFSDIDNVNTFSYNEYDASQLTAQNLKYIELYIGEDVDTHYRNFFLVNDVELNESNIILFRPLVLLYAGYVKNGGVNSNTEFKSYIKSNIFIKSPVLFFPGGSSHRLSVFLSILTQYFSRLKQITEGGPIKIVTGYNNRDLKIELYNYFKSFNDKWIAGNSIGQRLLLEEFLFLDKANKDIGDKFYFNIQKLTSLGESKNDNANLYSVISMLLQGSGLDMRPLPAYVNFYGTNFSNKSKITPSKKLAANLFGTYLDVDYEEASPKIIIQLVGPSSKHLDNQNKDYKFADDSFNISNVNNNPLIITLPQVFNTGDLNKSNKVVAFEVSFGDQNQSIFKGVSLDQQSLKNTSESFVVLENLARSESGAGAYNVDTGLFDYYRQASYTCEVTCLGNVMIQPTMFFYLKNIPMFKGSYWITEVSHDIRNNNIITRFKGTRIPYASLPDPKDSFVSSYRSLFDRLMTNVIAKIENETKNKTINEFTVSNNGQTYTIDPGPKVEGEDFDNINVKKNDITEFGLPYNGYMDEKYVQLVKYNNEEWLRARVVQIGGPQYILSGDTEFGVISRLKNTSKLTWSEISGTTSTHDFFSTKFRVSDKFPSEKIITAKTQFINPKNKNTVSVNYSNTGSVGSRKFTGPIGTGPVNLGGYGIGMSWSLMLKLKLTDGDVVYFQMK
jgi:hypothetical protein